MKKLWLLLTVFLLGFPLYAQEMLLEGVYQGKDLYVQNPMATDFKEFCVQEVYVNDKKMAERLQTSAFVVRLSHLQIGQRVRVRFIHKEGCRPRVLNPQVIRAESGTFQFRAFRVSEDSARWVTAGKHKEGLFVVEKLQGSQWKPVETLETQADSNVQVFSVKVSHDQGKNKYRIRLVEQKGQVYYTQEEEFVVE
jgi:hypothetical protein